MFIFRPGNHPIQLQWNHADKKWTALFPQNCSFLQIVLSSFFTNSLHYFTKLGMVQRNLEPERVFPGTSQDLKCSREASSIQTRYPSRPLQTLLLKHHCSSAAFEQISKVSAFSHWSSSSVPSILSLKSKRTFQDLQGWELAVKVHWGAKGCWV